MFPITSRAALIGMFEGPLPTTGADERMVGVLNMWSACYAKRFLYSASGDFRIMLSGGDLGSREEFFQSRHDA